MIARLRWWLAARLRPGVHEQAKELTAIVTEYADHQSWRCEYPPHYYLAGDPPPNGDCACGLLSALEAAGIGSEAWR